MTENTGLADQHPVGEGVSASPPNPAAREMIDHLAEAGIETVSDRLASQQPQCTFGLRGVCCKMCQMGPCRISSKSPRGVCGRTMDIVVAANLLRGVAAGTSAQTMHAREMILTLKAVSEGRISLSVQGSDRLREVGNYLNVSQSWTSPDDVTRRVAEAMLDDLGRLTEGRMRAVGFSPRDRKSAWESLGLTPRSAAYEVLESMHMTTMGACSDFDTMIRQALRTALAYAYTGLVASSVLSDILFGVPEIQEAEVNYGVLDADHVNILVHGHSPVMLEKILEKVATEELKQYAEDTGAAGIIVGGMCCTGHEALARHGVPTVAGATGQELIVGTGAVDAVVVDMQCVLPGMAAVAECFGTQIITTCGSNRIPGALHVPFDPEHPETLDEDAERIVKAAIDTFASRDRSSIHIPEHKTTVMTGFTRESVLSSFGSARQLVSALQDGRIRGVVAMVGCTTPKVAHESSHVTIARELIREGVLVLTSGCSAHALLNAGLCSKEAAENAAPGLREACEAAGVPPALVVGGCSDNTRIIQVFAMLAHYAQTDFPDMPFVVSGPEFANEKTMGQMMGVLAHGLTTVVGLTPGLPIPASSGRAPQGDDDAAVASKDLVEFFEGDGLHSIVGSRLLVRPEPLDAARTIVQTIDEKRAALGWESL